MVARPLHMSPSILAADTANLSAAVAAAQAAGAHSIHVDVMDGHYVANFAFSPKNIDDLSGATTLPLHAHLEVSDPDRCVPLFAHADMIIVQEDTTPNLAATLARIRAAGCEAGVGVNPERPLGPVLPLLAQIDLLLLLAVAPGFGGQVFNPVVLEKARHLAEHRARAGLPFAIGVDGGINAVTIGAAAAAGVDFFVAGTAVFGVSDTADEPVASIKKNLAHLSACVRRGQKAE
jgi:ribulose-phosphate 3-epimerase